jgi:hypothetical protein
VGPLAADTGLARGDVRESRALFPWQLPRSCGAARALQLPGRVEAMAEIVADCLRAAGATAERREPRTVVSSPGEGGRR